MRAVCFTGHRQVKVTDELKREIIRTLETEIKNGTEDFYSGGALGWDCLCSMAVIALKKKYDNIKLHLILPCPEHTARWNGRDKELFRHILESADSAEYTSEHYTKDCMKIRNARLVELAGCCICYYSGTFISGTGQTVRMAERKGIPVHNLFSNN